MTYPASGSQNQWGYYTPASTYTYPSDGGVPPATGTLDPPQSPSGSVTGESATSNYATGETSTETFLADVLVVDRTQQGTPAISNVTSITASMGGINPNLVQVNRWQ